MKKWLIYLLCGVLCLSLAACTNPDEKEDTTPTDQGQVQENVYVPDETVNRFLLDYKKASGFSLDGLTAGDYAGEYLLPVNMCTVRLSSTDVGICATIEGGKTEKAMERLQVALQIICLVADKSCTKQQLEDAVAWMNQQTETVGGYRICNNVKVLSYTPPLKDETLALDLDCSVRLLMMNYLPVKK